MRKRKFIAIIAVILMMVVTLCPTVQAFALVGGEGGATKNDKEESHGIFSGPWMNNDKMYWEVIDATGKNGKDENKTYLTDKQVWLLEFGNMVKQYGMTSGEAVAFIDNDEIWYMEILSGHQWAAHRLPDDEYACIGNDCLLDFYDPDDSQNWMGSDNVVELTKQAGTYTELDGKFHLALSYATDKRDYSQLRIWASRRYFRKYQDYLITDRAAMNEAQPAKSTIYAVVNHNFATDRSYFIGFGAQTTGTNARRPSFGVYR